MTLLQILPDKDLRGNQLKLLHMCGSNIFDLYGIMGVPLTDNIQRLEDMTVNIKCLSPVI